MGDYLTAEELEALDPAPDVHSLFAYYNDLYFNGKLGACSVEWSTKRMTMCAGICCYSRTSGCRIKLSEPLLKYRPTRDLKDTLLHEMIHAELFLDGVRNDGDHGPIFQSRMRTINSATCTDHQRPAGGYHITVYHTMHDEVNLYRTHVWTCDRCGNTVKRSMNRPPQEADCRSFTKAAAAAAAAQGQPGSYCKDSRCWYHLHVKHCGGKYIKTSEPDKPTSKDVKQQGGSSSKSNKRAKQPAPAAATANGMQSIETMFSRHNQQQQHKQQEQPRVAAEDSGDEQPYGPVPEAQQQVLQQVDQRQERQQLQEEQQQVDQRQPVQELATDQYWKSLGQGRMLGSTVVQQSTSNRRREGPSVSDTHRQASSGKVMDKDMDALHQIGSSKQPGGTQHQQLQDHIKQQDSNGLPLLEQSSQRQRSSQQKQEGTEAAAKSNNSLLRAVEVVELLSSDDEHYDGDVPGPILKSLEPVVSQKDVTAGGDGSIPGPCIVGPSFTSKQAVSGGLVVQGSDVSSGGSGVLTCPVCCQEWREGQISNGQLNAHVDSCLARMC